MMRRQLWTSLLTVSAAFLGGATAVSVLPNLTSQRAWADNPTTPVVTDVIALSDRFTLVAKRLAPAVVSIEARKTGHGSNSKKMVEDSGSGVVVKLENRPGYFVFTNNHIVENAAPKDIVLLLAD